VKLVRSIHIEAPPERVWAVISDVERWTEWTPSVLSIKRLDSGPFRVGSEADIELRLSPRAVWTVTKLDEGRMFIWEAQTGGVVVSAAHIVEPDGGGTKATLTIEPRGVLGTILSPLIVWRSRKNVEAEAAGLKRRSEEVGG
jgi:carbon monoxide dehydrogenase subunit G